ncbi:MAG TPA: hypothetical protein VML57_08935 [Burkholderiales bacterium]|nr:hypothetical protein [Burkholderiales bacterium]
MKMKRLVSHTIGTAVLALSFGAWAQTAPQEREATINVVPPSAVNDPNKILLPGDEFPGSEEGRMNSTFGRTTAGTAKELKGDFGKGVAEAAGAARDLPEFAFPKPPAP